jgi:hypothetical protein
MMAVPMVPFSFLKASWGSIIFHRRSVVGGDLVFADEVDQRAATWEPADLPNKVIKVADLGFLLCEDGYFLRPVFLIWSEWGVPEGFVGDSNSAPMPGVRWIEW